MSNEFYKKMLIDLDSLFYEFEHLQNRNDRKREIRCLFAKIKREIKYLKEDDKK